MRRKLVIAAAIALTVLSVTLMGAECYVEALFVSPAVDGVIEARIIEEISGAQQQLLIALYSFTDDELGAAVISAHRRGVDVYVLMDDGQDSDSQGREWGKLVAAGIPVAVEHATGLLHHKFAVIDRQVVVTGSYNWSDSADDRNFENIVVIDCPEIAQQFADEFSYIANSVLHLGWIIGCSESQPPPPPPPEATVCLECLERLNRATEGQFDACNGIGDALAPRLVQYQPYTVAGACTRAAIEEALQAVPYIGPSRARDVVDCICGDLLE